jgi:dipeptidase D
MLADALKVGPWPDNGPGALVNFLNDLVGTGVYGERFGRIAYRDRFMGPMTVVPTVIRQVEGGLELCSRPRSTPRWPHGSASTASWPRSSWC